MACDGTTEEITLEYFVKILGAIKPKSLNRIDKIR
jgi:hypothetical protein